MICLAMIVKDEAAVIARAIEHASPFIDCFAIVDTGSTDDTVQIAREALRYVPGEIESAPWEGYGPSRTRSLALAARVTGRALGPRKHYALVVDADDIWSGRKPTLPDEADAYAVWFQRPGARWTTTRLLKLGTGIRYEGAVHEMPTKDGGPLGATVIDDLSVTSPNDGATWRDPNKYLTHARMIQDAMRGDPTNTRYAFYLAQSYRDHGDDARASVLYLQRAAMGPGLDPEEIYVSYLEAGRALWRLGRMDDAKRALLNAHAVYPQRREAMAELARLFAVKAATSPTVGRLFVETGLDEAQP